MEKRSTSDGREPPGRASQRKFHQANSPHGNILKPLKPSHKPDKNRGRLIVSPTTHHADKSSLQKLYESAVRTIPHALNNWDESVSIWLDEYRAQFGPSPVLEVNLDIAVYVFDESLERVLVAYCISSSPLFARDKNRLRWFPDVNAGVKKALGKNAFVADRGHFLGHAAGGTLDINLFPQRRELNQARSCEGKLFRKMERKAAANLGTFLYHRATYNDDTWIPDTLEFGLLVDDKDWWIETFQNK